MIPYLDFDNSKPPLTRAQMDFIVMMNTFYYPPLPQWTDRISEILTWQSLDLETTKRLPLLKWSVN